MHESLNADLPRFTPADMARLILRKQEHEKGYDQQQAGDIIEIDNIPYELVPLMMHVRNRRTGETDEVPYTYRGYYSHHDLRTYEPGPGWDSLRHLTDDKYSMTKHGRTFTLSQAQEPSVYMPETPVFLMRAVVAEQ